MRNKIAISLFVLVILSRATDIFTTYYYSPDLAFEANPVVIMSANQGLAIFGLFVLALVVAGVLCFRLAKINYTKPFISEKIVQQVFNKPIVKTDKRRYVSDFYTVLGIALMGFGFATCWYVFHNYKTGIANRLAGVVVYDMPIYAIFVVAVCFGIAYLIGNTVVDRHLPQLNTPN